MRGSDHHRECIGWSDGWGCHEDCPVLNPVHDCGYPDGSFACKIRHIQVNTGWAKARND